MYSTNALVLFLYSISRDPSLDLIRPNEHVWIHLLGVDTGQKWAGGSRVAPHSPHTPDMYSCAEIG